MSDRWGFRARKTRRWLGLTQEQMAAEIGIHRVTLAKVERGRQPGAEVRAKIAAYIARMRP